MRLLWVRPRSPSETASGMFVKAMIQLMMLDVPMRNMMIPVISALLWSILGMSPTVMDL